MHPFGIKLSTFLQKLEGYFIIHDGNFNPLKKLPLAGVNIFWAALLLQQIILLRPSDDEAANNPGHLDQALSFLNKTFSTNISEEDNFKNLCKVLTVLCMLYHIAKALIVIIGIIVMKRYPRNRKFTSWLILIVNTLNMLDFTLFLVYLARINLYSLIYLEPGFKIIASLNILFIFLEYFVEEFLSYEYTFRTVNLLRERTSSLILIRILGVVFLTCLWCTNPFDTRNESRSLELIVDIVCIIFHWLMLAAHVYSLQFAAIASLRLTITLVLLFLGLISLHSFLVNLLPERHKFKISLLFFTIYPLLAKLLHSLYTMPSTPPRTLPINSPLSLRMYYHLYDSRSKLSSQFTLFSNISAHMSKCTHPTCLCFAMRVKMPSDIRPAKVGQALMDIEDRKSRMGYGYAVGLTDDALICDKKRAEQKELFKYLLDLHALARGTKNEQSIQRQGKESMQLCMLEPENNFHLFMHSLFQRSIRAATGSSNFT